MPTQTGNAGQSLNHNLIDAEEALAPFRGRAVIQEEVLPLREFGYREESDAQGNRRVTLKKDGRSFQVKDPHAMRQLCGLIHYPATVFQENDPALNMTIMKERLPRVRSSKHLVKWVQTGEGSELRGVLPHSYVTVRDLEMGEIAAQTLPGFRFNMVAASGPVTTLRIISPEDVFQIEGQELRLGMTLTMSEVGATKLVLDTLLFVPRCVNGAIVTWGSDRYFTHNYREVQAQDLRDIFTNLLARFRTERPNLVTKLNEAVHRKLSHSQVVEMWEQIKVNRAVSKAFVEEIAGEFTLQAESATKTVWDVTQHITQKAHEQLAPLHRIRHEIFAGQMLGLDLDPSVLGRG